MDPHEQMKDRLSEDYVEPHTNPEFHPNSTWHCVFDTTGRQVAISWSSSVKSRKGLHVTVCRLQPHTNPESSSDTTGN